MVFIPFFPVQVFHLVVSRISISPYIFSLDLLEKNFRFPCFLHSALSAPSMAVIQWVGPTQLFSQRVVRCPFLLHHSLKCGLHFHDRVGAKGSCFMCPLHDNYTTTGVAFSASALSEKMFLFGIFEINQTEDFQRVVHKFLCLKAQNYLSLA